MPLPIIGIAVAIEFTGDVVIPLLMHAAAHRVLMKFGAFVWQRARTSITPSKRPSQPGRPPHTHQKTLPKSIRFAYDEERTSVVIGPVPLPGKTGTAPAALEAGGNSKLRTMRRGIQVVRTSAIRARPFMGPALEAEEPNLPPLWANCLKG